MSLLKLLIAAVLVVFVLQLTPHLNAQKNSEQIVFSGTGNFTYTNQSPSPSDNAFGFWIWCESQESSNPYHGECNGAMYFYGLGITKHVAGDVIESTTSEGVYQMSVVSTKDDTVSCTLTNTLPTQSGPRNTINVSCTAPLGSGASSTAVINVTGKS